MAYEPNHDAARVLITEILPKVRLRYPGARVFVVGKNPRPDLIALANQEINVYVTGTVSDVRPYLAVSDLAVIPLTVGGGTRLKLLEAFASRLAVVSTTKGAEGIATAGSKEVAIADSVDKMVEEILSLLDDRQRWSLQVDRAYALVESQFSWQALGKRLPEEISKVLEPPTRVF
jgi:glycosyltransferase involved in cell wall biosynthesis